MLSLRKISLGAALFAASGLFANNGIAAEATGVWLRDTGASKVRIAPCGDALCGTIIWDKAARNDIHNPDEAKRSRPLVGTRVFFNMKANGANNWSGSAYNPEDGKTYTGAMVLNGDNLTTKGCVLGGLICKSAGWSRSN